MRRIRKGWILGSALVAVVVLALALPVMAQALPSYTTQWGTTGNANGKFNDPTHIAADGLGHVYVCDWSNSAVQRFSSTGAFEASWTVPGGVEGIAVGRTPNTVLLATWNSSRVTIRNASTGATITVVGAGTTGSGNGQFSGPEAVAFDRYGFIYVADALNHRIQKFRPTGTYLTQWGSYGVANGKFNRPYGINVDSLGNVYVADYWNSRVQQFTSSGAWVRSWGTTGTGTAQMNRPAGIDIGQDGNVYVAEYGNNRVHAFTPTGSHLMSWGTTGTGNGQFNGPWGIASDGTGIYVVDRNNNRVEKFTLTQAKQTTRLGGADRFAVAVNMARARWGASYYGVNHVIVVNGEDYANADPLAAAGLAGIWDAPVLLTKSTGLPTSTKNAITQMRANNGPLRIHVIGGTGSIPSAIVTQLNAINVGGIATDRVNGVDRYDLSAQIARRMKIECDAKGVTIPAVLLFNGQNSATFYDALAASPLSAGGQVPMMAIRPTGAPGSVMNVLNGPLAGKPRIVVNSATYIPESVRISLSAGRLATTTNRALAAGQISAWGRLLGWVGLRHIGIANKLPDALTGGSFVGNQGGVLLYSDYASVPTQTKNVITVYKIGSQQGWVFGGPASVSDAALASFNTVLNTP
jgi:sugar lactone lactonase YvrE